MPHASAGVNSSSALPLPGVERFVYVIEGSATVLAGGESRTLEAEGYAFFPAGLDHKCASLSARMLR
jgi:(S)-ureidoglycine aminohydrolase